MERHDSESGAVPDKRDRFVALLDNIRHYSTLRFAMLTVFVLASGGLLQRFFDCDFAACNPHLSGLFCAAGMLLSVIFFVFERALDHNLSCHWVALQGYVSNNDSLLAHRNGLYRWAVPLATHSIFVASFIFWSALAPDYYPCRG